MAQSIIGDPYLQDTKTAVITGAATGAIAGFLHGGITGAIKGATAGAILNYVVYEAMKRSPTVNATD